jgi:nucleoside-diphosphate-sugar epimerase
MNLDGKRLGITGVGGFIGARLAQRARERGMVVRGLDQSESAAKRPELAGVEVIVGDICDPSAARALCANADVVVHTAAVVREHGPLELFRRVNVGGSDQVAVAARAQGAQRFVHLSSVMVYGFDYPNLVAEEGPLRGEGNPYCETKIEGERAVQRHHQPGAFEVTVIRPGDVYGPGSVPWVIRPFELLRAGIFVLPSGGRGLVNHVYVDNLVDALLLAAERDASGVFTVSDGIGTPCRDFFAPIARASGRSRIPTAPAWVLRPTFGLMKGVFALVGRDPPAVPSTVDYLMRPYPYSIEKARRDLGFVPAIALDEGMRRVRDWLADDSRLGTARPAAASAGDPS